MIDTTEIAKQLKKMSTEADGRCMEAEDEMTEAAQHPAQYLKAFENAVAAAARRDAYLEASLLVQGEENVWAATPPDRVSE